MTTPRSIVKETATGSQLNQVSPASSRPPEIDALLTKIRRCLEDDSPQKALELISRTKLRSPWIENATGVCQLRLGNARVAVDVYRRLLVTGGIFLRPDAPTIFKTNFAIALLMNDNLSGFYSTLAEVKDDGHSAVIKLQDGIKAWKQSLTLWQRILLACGIQPKTRIDLGFPPGELE